MTTTSNLVARLVAAVLFVGWFCQTMESAEVRLAPHPLFSEGAVLQRGVRLPEWGTAEPGEKITVSLNGQSGQTNMDLQLSIFEVQQ